MSRLVQQPSDQRSEDGALEMADDGGGSTVQQASHPPALSTVYLVRSAQKPTGRRSEASTAAAVASQTFYIAHTAAWNCTCAAFAFAAFPPATPALSTWANQDDLEKGWVFGGMSFDGMDESEGGVPPCCKHLLACVLAERWVVLRDYVNERMVGREELAGIFADV